jgi:hypothetical protein
MLFALAIVGFAAFFLAGFLESGAGGGQLALDPAESYAAGTVSYIPTRNVYVVRQADRSFIALSDLDAANRAAPTRCRVAQIALADPVLPGLLQQYGSRMSAAAAGSTLILRESCNRAAYDATGLRLDRDGPNLDRFAVGIDSQGRLTVDMTKRTCTERTATQPFAPTACPK